MELSNLEVVTKNVYGTELIYPNCDRSKAFLRALGLKTFTPAASNAAFALGYQLITSPNLETMILNGTRQGGAQ